MMGWPLSEVIRFVLQSFWKNPIIIIFMLITPLLLIFLSSTVLQEEAYEPTIGVEEISERMQASLLQQDVNVEQTSTAMALNKLSAGEMDAFFHFRESRRPLNIGREQTTRQLQHESRAQ